MNVYEGSLLILYSIKIYQISLTRIKLTLSCQYVCPFQDRTKIDKKA